MRIMLNYEIKSKVRVCPALLASHESIGRWLSASKMWIAIKASSRPSSLALIWNQALNFFVSYTKRKLIECSSDYLLSFHSSYMGCWILKRLLYIFWRPWLCAKCSNALSHWKSCPFNNYTPALVDSFVLFIISKTFSLLVRSWKVASSCC